MKKESSDKWVYVYLRFINILCDTKYIFEWLYIKNKVSLAFGSNKYLRDLLQSLQYLILFIHILKYVFVETI